MAQLRLIAFYGMEHWDPAQPVSRGVVASSRHQFGRPSPLYAHHDLRDLSLPGRAVPGCSRRRRRHRPARIAIADSARRLVELRERWIHPPESVEWVEEPAPGYPKRPVPRDEGEAKQLRQRTLTHLYNACPQWLLDAHERLDAAVAAAYGWAAGISDDDALRNLLSRNLAG